jgi:hypothetical protein
MATVRRSIPADHPMSTGPEYGPVSTGPSVQAYQYRPVSTGPSVQPAGTARRAAAIADALVRPYSSSG